MTMPASTPWFIPLLLSILVSAPLQAQAPPEEEEKVELGELSEQDRESLRLRLQTARAEYSKGAFETALEDFKKAYALFPHPSVLFRIADCYERLGKPRKAIKAYRDFLQRQPESKARERIERSIVRLEKKLEEIAARVTVRSSPKGANVFIDEKTETIGLTPVTKRATPGVHTVIVRKDGFREQREEVTLRDGQALVLDYTLEEPGLPTASWVFFSVGGASMITGLIFLGLYSDLSSDLDAQFQSSDERPVGYDEEYERAAGFGTVSVVTLSAGAAMIGLGLLFWALDDQDVVRKQNQLRPSAALGTNRDGQARLQLGLTGSF